MDVLFYMLQLFFSTAVGLTCSSGVNECEKHWFWCDTTTTTCKCGKVYAAGTTLDTSCTGASKDNFFALLMDSSPTVIYLD